MQTSLTPHSTAASFLAPAAHPGRTNQAVSESFRSQSQSAIISLTTQEGDRITISQDSLNQERHAEFSRAGGSAVIEQSLAASGMSIAVQGDLNEQELSDLTSLIGDLGAIASDFFSGHLSEAVNGALAIGDMGSINKLEATFSRTSILAGYMQGPHPLPSFSGTPTDLLWGDLLPPESADQMSTPALGSSLPALWQQFIDSLNQAEALPPPSPPKPTDYSAAQTADQMLGRGRQTMNTHPRLTPLMPAMTGLAIDQASRLFEPGHATDRSAKELMAAYTKAFNNWTL